MNSFRLESQKTNDRLCTVVNKVQSFGVKGGIDVTAGVTNMLCSTSRPNIFAMILMLTSILGLYNNAVAQDNIIRVANQYQIIVPGVPGIDDPKYNMEFNLHFTNARSGANLSSDTMKVWSMKNNPRVYRNSGDTFWTPVNAAALDTCFHAVGKTCAPGFRYFIVTSLDSGLVDFSISSDGGDPGRFKQIYYYYPRFRFYLEDGSEITSSTSIRTETGENIKVTAKAFMPKNANESNWTKFDSTLSSISKRQQLILSTTGADTNLQIYRANSDGSFMDQQLDSVLLDSGETTFYVKSAVPVNGGSLKFRMEMLSQDLSFKPSFNIPVPGKFNISYGDAPSMDSASLYDMDGDGVGDSVVAWFDAGLDKKPTNPVMSWPYDSTMTAANKNGGSLAWVAGNDSIGWQVDEIPVPRGTNPAGDFGVTVTGKSGNLVETTAPLHDRVGPVIQTVTMRPGHGGESDTLIIRFNKNIDGDFKEGDAFLVNGERIFVTGDSIGDRTWQFILDEDASNITDVGDSITIDVDGGIVAADGNKPNANNRPAVIREAGTLPPLSQDGNGFYDSDGDGSLDSITVEFEEAITQDILDSLEFNFVWKDTAGNPIRLPLGPDDYVWDPKNPKVITWKFDPDSMGIMPFLTSIKSEDYGFGTILNHYEIDGESVADTVPVTMLDRMAPVLVNAQIWPVTSSSKKGDSLELRFSEPIDPDALLNNDFLDFLMTGDSKDPSGTAMYEWNDSGTVLGMRIAKGDPLRQRPNPGDSLRILAIANGIADTNGNTMSQDGPRVMLLGDARVLEDSRIGVGIKARADIGDDAPKDKNGDPMPISLSFWDDGTTVEDLPAGSLGILLDVGPSTLGEEDELRGTLALDKGDIGLSWQLYVYTNFGGFVASSKGEVNCADTTSTGFDGDCFKNRKQIYISWNLLAENGRKVGFGVYVAKLHVNVWGNKDKKMDQVYQWGVGPCGKNRKMLCRD